VKNVVMFNNIIRSMHFFILTILSKSASPYVWPMTVIGVNSLLKTQFIIGVNVFQFTRIQSAVSPIEFPLTHS